MFYNLILSINIFKKNTFNIPFPYNSCNKQVTLVLLPAPFGPKNNK